MLIRAPCEMDVRLDVTRRERDHAGNLGGGLFVLACLQVGDSSKPNPGLSGASATARSSLPMPSCCRPASVSVSR